MTEREQPVADCCRPGGACYDAGLADIQHRRKPTEREQERAAIVAWLRKVAPMLVRTQQAALEMAADNIEAGSHLRGEHVGKE